MTAHRASVDVAPKAVTSADFFRAPKYGVAPLEIYAKQLNTVADDDSGITGKPVKSKQQLEDEEDSGEEEVEAKVPRAKKAKTQPAKVMPSLSSCVLSLFARVVTFTACESFFCNLC